MKSIRRKAIAAILVILMVAMALSACGGKGDTKEEAPGNAADNGGEPGDSGEADADEEPEAEEPEPVEPHVAWVVEPTGKYKDIGQLEITYGRWETRERTEIYDECFSCTMNKIGYPQQWYEDEIPDSEGGGTIKYSADAFAFSKEGNFSGWGIMDYSGNVLVSPNIKSIWQIPFPFGTGYSGRYSGIGYEDYSSVSGSEGRVNIFTADYSDIAYSFEHYTGGGTLSAYYYTHEGKLYRSNQSTSEEVTTVPDQLKTSLAPSYGSENAYMGPYSLNYTYIAPDGKLLLQEAYYIKNYVNGYYVGLPEMAENSGNPNSGDLVFGASFVPTPQSPNQKFAIVEAATGKPITDYKYHDALYFEEGYCPVERDGKWGFIDETGAEVTDLIFDKVSTIYDGRVAVIIDGNFAIIDLEETLASGFLTKELVEEALAVAIANRVEEDPENKASDMKFPEDFVGAYSLTSGAGAWATSIELHEDGTFEGAYHDSEMGMTGEGYPHGTVYHCTFSGKFVLVKEVEYNTYSVELQDLKLEDEEGKEEIKDGIKYIATGPFGLEHSNSFIFKGKGSDGRNLSDTMRMWLLMPMWMTEEELESEDGLPKSIMINSNSEETFVNTSN